jgi:hypothetical protein
MGRCEVCGNDYDKSFQVNIPRQSNAQAVVRFRCFCTLPIVQHQRFPSPSCAQFLRDFHNPPALVSNRDRLARIAETLRPQINIEL